MIKVYALLVGRPWREPKYSYLIAFYEELRAGTIGRDRGKKAARGAPMDIIAVLSALRGHNCAEGGVRRLLAPSSSLVPELRVAHARHRSRPTAGVSTAREGAMGTFFGAVFPVNKGTNSFGRRACYRFCNRPSQGG